MKEEGKYILFKAAVKEIGRFEDDILNWTKRHIKHLVIAAVFGIIIYLMMISGNLVNSYDGIWNTSRMVAGAWETSLGRGFLHYLDKMRAGIVSMVLNSVITLLVISVASALILDLFPTGSKGLNILVSFLLIVNPVICVTLSYCYTSVGYGMAFLFSVLSVNCICREKMTGVFAGAICIAVSLGCYQAYFGVTCLLLLLRLIKMLLNITDTKKIVYFAARGMLSIALGGIIYSTVSRMLLNKYGVELASYGGASEVSLWKTIVSLPLSIQACYKKFYNCFFGYKMYIVFEKSNILLASIGVIVLFCVIRQFTDIWPKKRIYAMLFLVCMCLVPVACNAVILLVPGNEISILMAMGMIMGIVLIPIVILPVTGTGNSFLKQVSCLMLLLLLWVNILTVENDQIALKEGKTATVELARAVVCELIVEGKLQEDTLVAFVGKPSENHLFAKREAWKRANSYAKFGDWWVDAANNRRSWRGILTEYCGIQLEICSAEKYEELCQTEEISGMPEFPAEGSVREIDGIVVVKISEAY